MVDVADCVRVDERPQREVTELEDEKPNTRQFDDEHDTLKHVTQQGLHYQGSWGEAPGDR